MKQRIGLLLLMAGVMLLFFIFGRYFYQKNLPEMCVVADSCFVNVLTSELESKQKEMNIPYFAACSSDFRAHLHYRFSRKRKIKAEFPVDYLMALSLDDYVFTYPFLWTDQEVLFANL